MKVRVDKTKCSGIGLCEMTAPTVFEIGPDGQAEVIDEHPSGEQRAAAEEAVNACPTQALSMEN